MSDYQPCWCGRDETTGGHQHQPARRFANLTSPETIEKGAAAAYKEFLGDDDWEDEVLYGTDAMTYRRVAEAVLRSVEEGTG